MWDCETVGVVCVALALDPSYLILKFGSEILITVNLLCQNLLTALLWQSAHCNLLHGTRHRAVLLCALRPAS